MAEAATDNSPPLAEQYFVKDKQEKTDVGAKPVEVKEVEKPKEEAAAEAASVEKTVEATPVVAEKSSEVTPPADETPVISEESSEVTPPTDESSEPNAAASEVSNHAKAEQSSGSTEGEKSGDQDAAEETAEIKLETAPVDFRFPTTNQTRHCFTRYIEYHRCIAAKGEDAPECGKFAKYYRALCPGEWVDKWNEQRENGTFPGPL